MCRSITAGRCGPCGKSKRIMPMPEHEPVMVSLGSIIRHDLFKIDGRTFRAMCDAKKIEGDNVHLYAKRIPTKLRIDCERSIAGEPSLRVERVEIS